MEFPNRSLLGSPGSAMSDTPAAGPRFITVASGKGGVGKTNISGNLAVSLSKLGKRVLIFDADMGLANMDILFGLEPRYNIRHVLEKRRSLAEVVVQGPGGVSVIPGGSGVVELAQLPKETLSRLALELARLAGQYDFVIIDAPAGIAGNVLRFTALADEVLLVTTPEPTAIIDAYALAKIVHTASTQKPIKLLVNMASDPDEGRHVAASFNKITKRFLQREIPCIGRLPYDPNVPLAVRRQQPCVIGFPDCTVSRLMRSISMGFLSGASHRERNLQRRMTHWVDGTVQGDQSRMQSNNGPDQEIRYS